MAWSGVAARRRAVILSGSDAWAWCLVVVGDEAIDGRLEIDGTLEGATFQATLGQGGKEAFGCVEPAGPGGREVERPAWMPAQHAISSGVLVAGARCRDRTVSEAEPALCRL